MDSLVLVLQLNQKMLHVYMGDGNEVRLVPGASHTGCTRVKASAPCSSLCDQLLSSRNQNKHYRYQSKQAVSEYGQTRNLKLGTLGSAPLGARDH